MRTKAVRIVLKCSPKQRKKGKKLKGFEVWASIDSKGFGEGVEETNTEFLCAKRALEVATAKLAHAINMPVEDFMRRFTNEVIRVYCKPEKFQDQN